MRYLIQLAFVMVLLIGTIATSTQSALAQEKSLFDRLGGAKAVGAVTIDLVNTLAADKRLTENNQVVADAFASANVLGLKKKLYQLICMATGGPCKYKGRSMPAAHDGMKITELEWHYFMDDLIQVLDKFNVPLKEKNEVLAIISGTKSEIVGK